MSNEIELKLEVAPHAAEQLLTGEQWFKASDCRSERQLSVYYDTPDSKLRLKGYSLRVRSVGTRFIQTVKALDHGAAMFARGEWESEVAGPLPDLSQLANTPLANLEIGQLEPLIRTEVDRTICRIKDDHSELELDVDLGSVRASGREMPLSELELELIDGEPKAATNLAQRIAADTPVKLAVMSKVERGFALADGRLFEPAKAEPVPIRRQMSIAEGFEAIVSSCLRHFRLNEPLVIETRNVEALHQCRVAIRRLRSAFSLFGRVVRDCEFEQIDDELRWLAAELGDSRNLDVYLQRDLTSDQREFLEERQSKAYDLSIAAMDSARCRKLVLELVAWSASGEWRTRPRAAKPLEAYMNARLDRAWLKIAKAKKVRRMTDKDQHHLRIKGKELRYSLEFADALERSRPKRKKKFTKAAKQLQQSLGKLHDIVTASCVVTLNSWIETQADPARDKRRLIRQADRSLRRLRRIGPYWGARQGSG